MRTHQLKIQWKFEMYEIITSVIQNNLKEMKQKKISKKKFKKNLNIKWKFEINIKTCHTLKLNDI